MSGSVFFVGLVIVIGIALAIFASPILLIPAVVFALLGLFWAPILALFAGGDRGRGTSGVPSTSEASYDPVADPSERGL